MWVEDDFKRRLFKGFKFRAVHPVFRTILSITGSSTGTGFSSVVFGSMVVGSYFRLSGEGLAEQDANQVERIRAGRTFQNDRYERDENGRIK
jgi:hypothetical protein